MRIVIINNSRQWFYNFYEWLIYLFGHAIILITVAVLFDSFYIDNAYFGLYGLIAAVIISILNVTIKPLLIILTLPITTLTLGLFYPFINVLILKITAFILGDYFIIEGVWVAFFIAVIISLMNILMDNLIIKPILGKGVTV